MAVAGQFNHRTGLKLFSKLCVNSSNRDDSYMLRNITPIEPERTNRVRTFNPHLVPPNANTKHTLIATGNLSTRGKHTRRSAKQKNIEGTMPPHIATTIALCSAFHGHDALLAAVNPLALNIRFLGGGRHIVWIAEKCWMAANGNCWRGRIAINCQPMVASLRLAKAWVFS